MAGKKRVPWREYQEQVAQYFRELGLKAEVETKVQGVRAEHTIDVWVTFESHGLEQRWVVECKRYGTVRVTKDKVLTLARIVEDVGAHAGILLSETGFQSGAINAAKKTNIQLTSLPDLYRNGEPAIIKQWMTEALPWLSDMRHKVIREITQRRQDPEQVGALQNLFIMLTRLNKMEEGLSAARNGDFIVKIDIKEMQRMTGGLEKILSDPLLMEIPVVGLIGALTWIRERREAFERRLDMIVRGEKDIFQGRFIFVGQVGPEEESQNKSEERSSHSSDSMPESPLLSSEYPRAATSNQEG